MLCLLILALPAMARAQENPESVAELKKEAAELRLMVEKLQQKIDRLESASTAAPVAAPVPVAAPETTAAKLLDGTTVNFLLDAYYEYNFNSPIGRANLLRAYDVSSNSFSLNQADVVLENAPDLSAGKRWGARVDLQFGQATETLQGNSLNEPRPEIYRNVFQAYGTYIAPVGRGLTVDFGKWSSSLGIEGNYTKDQMNYSRSFWFDYLPFYHMGARASYNFSDQFAVHYWVTNGTQQTEAFNGFKDESFGFAWQPVKSVNWTANYYLGQEHPDVIFYPNGLPAGVVNPPTLQGVPFEPITPALNGKLHIFDSYVTWQATPKWSFAADGDYVIERDDTNSAPGRVEGGTLYGRYQWTPKIAFAGRAEYMSDRGGLYTGVSQSLKEGTATIEYKFDDALLLRWEVRRDFSNHPFFYTDMLNVLKREQTTAGMGLVWWFGGKKGAW